MADETGSSAAVDDRDAITVLHVTGSGRSGSTLLTSTLGSVPGVFAAGEIRFLWERALVNGEPCGCGRSPHECPVWGPVLERLGPVTDADRAAEVRGRLAQL